MMLASILDLAAVLTWPLLLSAAAWAIAICALAEPDEISKTVKALTRPSRMQQNGNPAD